MATCLKNVNIYWLLGTGILSWFFFIHTPPLVEHLREFRRPIFLFHLTCAFGLCFACVHNTLLTPSVFDGKAKSFHVWVGRAGMVFGLASFVAGAYLAWCPVQDYGFSIPITIGGVLQLHSQKTGYGAIMQYKELKKRLADLNSESKEADEVRAEQQKASLSLLRTFFGFGWGLGLVGSYSVVKGI
ncbi:unnamed protein product [Symbiodinium microadriaticum]|nr:unnamed protein product [Symbiodinium microadriaticum]